MINVVIHWECSANLYQEQVLQLSTSASQPFLIPVLDRKMISMKKIKFWGKTTFFSKMVMSKDVVKISKEAVEKVFILTILD